MTLTEKITRRIGDQHLVYYVTKHFDDRKINDVVIIASIIPVIDSLTKYYMTYSK